MSETFPSLLYGGYKTAGQINPQAFADLNLDRLLPEETLAILAAPCPTPLITARQEIFALLADSGFTNRFIALKGAAVELSQAHEAYNTARNRLETLLLFIRFARCYAAFCRLAECFNESAVLIAGFAAFFRASAEQTARLEAALDAIAPQVLRISASVLYFSEYATTLDTCGGGLSVASKIRRAATALGFELPARRPQSKLRTEPYFSDALLKRYESETEQLERFAREFSPLLDPAITGYKRELDFYLTIRELCERASKAGVKQCFPALADVPRFALRGSYDVTLLLKSADGSTPVIVPNDAEFSADESVWFLTGANGGGKTTYLRAVAVNLILALAGAPVFAASAEVWAFTAVYTHFPADERFTGSGRLVEEARRADEILSNAGHGVFVFLNETYSGTDNEKGVALTLGAAESLRDRGAFALYVTHFHEVADAGFPMLNTVINAADPALRTFRIVKSSALRSSYALDILRKYGLDAESLGARGTGDGERENGERGTVAF